MVPGMEHQPFGVLPPQPGGDAGTGGGQISGAFQPLDGEHLPFAATSQCLPGPLFRGG